MPARGDIEGQCLLPRGRTATGDHTFSFQYPLREAGWTFCSRKRRFSAVAMASGRLRSCSARSGTLPVRSGSVVGLCGRRAKSCRRVCGVALFGLALHVYRGPRQFPDKICTQPRSRRHKRSPHRFSTAKQSTREFVRADSSFVTEQPRLRPARKSVSCQNVQSEDYKSPMPMRGGLISACNV
jgi:hypothetical protein